MTGMLMTMSIAAAMMVPLVVGLGAGYLALYGMLTMLRAAVEKASEETVALDNVVSLHAIREARAEEAQIAA